MKKLLAIALFLFTLNAYSQTTPITPSWRNFTPQPSTTDSIKATWTGKPDGYSEFYTGGYIKRTFLKKADTASISNRINQKADSARLYGIVLPLYAKKDSLQLTLLEYAAIKGVPIGTANDSTIIQQYIDEPTITTKRFDAGRQFNTSGINIGANTHIVAYGSKIRLTDSANRPIITNRNWRLEGIDTNIVIEGGIWNGNDAHQIHHLTSGIDSGEFVYGLKLMGVNGLVLRDVRVDSARTFSSAIQGSNIKIYNYIVNQRFVAGSSGGLDAYNQDGPHVYGPTTNLIIDGLTGTTTDDFIAVNSTDNVPQGKTTKKNGPITNVTLMNITATKAKRGIRLLSEQYLVDNIVVKNFTGNIVNSGILVSAYQRQYGTGLFGKITIDGVSLNVDSGMTSAELVNNQYGYLVFNDGIDHLIVNDVKHNVSQWGAVPTIKIERTAKMRLGEFSNISTKLNKAVSAATSISASDLLQSDIIIAKGAKATTIKIDKHTITNGTAGKGTGISAAIVASTGVLSPSAIGKLIITNSYYDKINRAMDFRDTAVVDSLVLMNNLRDSIGVTPVVVGLATTIKNLVLSNNGWVSNLGVTTATSGGATITNKLGISSETGIKNYNDGGIISNGITKSIGLNMGTTVRSGVNADVAHIDIIPAASTSTALLRSVNTAGTFGFKLVDNQSTGNWEWWRETSGTWTLFMTMVRSTGAVNFAVPPITTGLTGILYGNNTSAVTSLGTSLPAVNGGTAQSTYTTGDLLYASTTNTLAKRAIGSTNHVLTVVGGVPTWAAPATNGTVTSITPGYGFTSSTPITTSGTMTIDTTTSMASKAYVNNFASKTYGAANYARLGFANTFLSDITMSGGAFSHIVNIASNTGFSYVNNGSNGDGPVFRAPRIAASFGNPSTGDKAFIYGDGTIEAIKAVIANNDIANSALTLTNSGSNATALNVTAGQALFNGPAAFNSSAISIGQFRFTNTGYLSFDQGAGVRFNNAAATYKLSLTWNNATSDKNINFRDKAGDVAMTDEATGYAVNATTTALSSADLNSTYPDVTLGYRIICHNITGAPGIYIKATEAGSSDVWGFTPITIVP